MLTDLWLMILKSEPKTNLQKLL